MKNVLRVALVASFAALLGSHTVAQQAVAPPPKPENGPSLEFTMKFIQDQLANRGVVSYRDKDPDPDGEDTHFVNRIDEVHTDPATCSLSFRVDETESYTHVVPSGKEYSHESDTSETFRFSFHDIAKLEVRDSDHPVIPDHTGHVLDPTVYFLHLTPSKGAIEYDKQCTGDDCAGSDSVHGKTTWFNPYLMFYFGDVANRVARAMLHAVELCGGGQKEPEPFGL